MPGSKTLSAWLAWLAGKWTPMRTAPLDDLLLAVVGGFRKGRVDIRRRALGSIEALVPASDGGTAPAVTLGSAGGQVSVPLAALAKIQLPSLAELSLEFDCVVETLRHDGRECVALRMVREGTHGACRLRIGVSAEERMIAAVTLNGELLHAHELEFMADDL